MNAQVRTKSRMLTALGSRSVVIMGGTGGDIDSLVIVVTFKSKTRSLYTS